MKNRTCSWKHVCLFLGALCLMSMTPQPTITSDEIIPLGSYVSSNQLSVEVTSMGGYSGECVAIKLKNNTSKTISTYLEPGRRLASDNSEEQDIFIVKKKQITVAPMASITFSGFGFCCQSHNKAPKKESTFSFGNMAPPEWVRLADTINNNEFTKSAIQSAVWSLSDGHSISGIHDPNRDDIMPLLETIADIKGFEIPWYSFSFAEDTSQLFSNIPKQIFGEFEYYLKNSAAVNVVVKRKNGSVMKHLRKGYYCGQGKQNFDVNFDVLHWPKGEYEIIVLEDYNNINCVKEFTIS